ncbi:hypothetical protein PR001_g2734 [Phytophthora rubi]|uniref:FAR1 domain-containing protein n=1 Tax=Phytophthora rubi TaxID=129364 RepID=A0A6A3NX26_9STRA|nr:hypothetical protein PR001_g2734 [Phytophthora rubi]
MTRQCDRTEAKSPHSSRDRGALEAIHAEEVARARLDEQETRLARDDRTQLTRKTAAMLRATHEKTVDGLSSKRRRRHHDEERALRETFGIDADSDDSTGSNDKRSFSGDDSDYEKNPEPSSDSDGDAEEPTQAACDSVDDSGEDSSNESKPTEAPNLHQTPSRTRSARRTGPVWFYGIKTTFASWEEFDRCFDEFQKDSFQQFSKRTSTSVATRNKQIIRTKEGTRLAGKKSRKEVKFVPDEWVTYSKTFLCTHGQPYEPRGTGNRSHNKVHDAKCGARVNLCVTAVSHGRWVFRAKGSGIHNHEESQQMCESYAENRVVEDLQLKTTWWCYTRRCERARDTAVFSKTYW